MGLYLRMKTSLSFFNASELFFLVFAKRFDLRVERLLFLRTLLDIGFSLPTVRFQLSQPLLFMPGPKLSFYFGLQVRFFLRAQTRLDFGDALQRFLLCLTQCFDLRVELSSFLGLRLYLCFC